MSAQIPMSNFLHASSFISIGIEEYREKEPR